MSSMTKFRCPSCQAGLSTSAEKVGRSYQCPRCQAPGTVPLTRALVPLPKAEVAPAPRPRKPVKRVPVALRFPGQLGGMQAKVSQKTANTMATATLGGMLVAIGVTLAALFLGGKPKAT